ncbi:5-formyltetrahydrofolate cyclo-ligase [Chitinophaga pendula]|uniref:5-formyltetrahydrofolate cyclo-ligase n=1 Tax=Chitinophaga TaxID=79328 RepID=UPI0012FE56E0|nr:MULTISPECIES: 5-formyltetrahydrofolate cyclo-ligase [Chitinophaga]UCJ09181.1 5-formyltetrahydrofolate cyclo-ligase [Chitinophaga pendula]
MATKKDIRKEYLEKRLNLPAITVADLNRQIYLQCTRLDYTNIRYLHLFLPISRRQEVDTWPIASWIHTQQPGISLVLSHSDMQTAAMTHFTWNGVSPLTENKYGIPEPDTNGSPIAPEQIDLVFVPLLAFDRHGQRVGYGKGMYDRFLSACRPDTRKIGLSFFGPVPLIADASPDDVPLDIVITPEQIYHFNKNN